MRYGIFACLVSFALCLAALPVSQASDAPQDPIEAVWRPQRVTFHYRSEGRMYACDILEHKVRRILTQLGAREQIVVRSAGCRDFARTAQLEVIMQSPVIASPENIRAITEYDSQDELIARVRGVHLPAAEDLERFPAVWASISIQRAPKVYVEKADCALVQQLRRQILPKMSVQIVRDIEHVDCAHSSPRMTVMALVATL
jgi:hypothetical protein